eukprot:459272_1
MQIKCPVHMQMTPELRIIMREIQMGNVINLSNATTAIQSVSGLRLPVINGTNLTQYGHHVDRNAISWNDNVTFRHNPMNTMHMQEPRNAFGSGYYNPYM